MGKIKLGSPGRFICHQAPQARHKTPHDAFNKKDFSPIVKIIFLYTAFACTALAPVMAKNIGDAGV
jgi:hypothetical protein